MLLVYGLQEMWWWIYVIVAVVQTGFVYWLHLPDDLLQLDPDGLVMTGFVAYLGLACGSPYHESGNGRVYKAVTYSLLLSLILSSAVMSFDLVQDQMYFRLCYYGLAVVLMCLSTILSIYIEIVSDAILIACSTAPFSVLYFGSIVQSP